MVGECKVLVVVLWLFSCFSLLLLLLPTSFLPFYPSSLPSPSVMSLTPHTLHCLLTSQSVSLSVNFQDIANRTFSHPSLILPLTYTSPHHSSIPHPPPSTWYSFHPPYHSIRFHSFVLVCLGRGLCKRLLLFGIQMVTYTIIVLPRCYPLLGPSVNLVKT